MDNVKEALEYAVSLSDEQIKIFDLKEGTFSSKHLLRVEEKNEPIAPPIQISTLTSLVDYIKGNIDKLDLTQNFVNIRTSKKAVLTSALNKDVNRVCSVVADAYTPYIEFNTYYDSESFNILLQSSFQQNEDRDIILKVVGNLQETAVKTVGDDGVSQSVVISSGIANVENVKVPNPVVLRPYRTFLEIEQPCSKFIFRMKEGGSCALFEADGGMWEIEAKQSIKYYLEENLQDIVPAIMIMA